MLSGASSTSLRVITTITFVVLVIDATLVATTASLGVESCWAACMILVIAIFLHVIWEIDNTYLVVTVAYSLHEGVDI